MSPARETASPLTPYDAARRTSRRRRALELIARACGGIAVALGIVVLLGWAFEAGALKSVVPRYVSMKPNTAVAFIAAGAALLLRSLARLRRAAGSLAVAAALLGLANLAEYAFGADFGIDQLLFRDTDPLVRIPPPGRMAPLTAFSFVLVGAAILVLDRARLRTFARALASVVMLLVSAVIAGYGYDISSLSPEVGYSTVAIHTALGLLALAGGVLLAHPDEGLIGILTSETGGGVMGRRLVPAAVLVPPVIGWLALKGHEQGLFDTKFGVALFAVSNVLVFLALVLWSAATLHDVGKALRAALDRTGADEAKLRLLVAHTPAALAMLDREMRYVLVSPRWTADFRLGDRDVTGLSHYELFPDLPEQWKEVHRRCLAGAHETCEEDSFVREDGTVEWLRWEVHPWREDGGEIGGIVIFAELTTARRKAEESLRRSEEQLRQSQRMEAIGRLAGGVAHDFNNLLTVINGYGEMLLDTQAGDPVARERVKEIVAAGRRAAALTGQLLAFSRKQVLDPSVIDLNEVLSGMERMIRRLIGEDVDFEARFAPNLWPVFADPGQMEQVVMNLAVNARDAMPRGGRLTLETRNAVLDEQYHAFRSEVPPGDYVLLAVSDTGVGMDPETKDKLFEPFFTTKEHGKGTGLGLATVYGIVKQSGGYIWLYSEPGQGATFKIYLPRSRGEAKLSRPLPAVATMGGTETVLVAEDDDALRRFACGALESRGYDVLSAPNGREALAAASRHRGRIDLLVTDMVMPDMSGRDVAEALRRARPETRVLYMSGYAEDAIVHNGRLDAGVEYIPKPFGPDALARKVRQVLDAAA